MVEPTRAYSAPWIIQEGCEAYRILDVVGNVLSEIRFGDSSSSGLSKAQAKVMAEKMVQAGKSLAGASIPDTAEAETSSTCDTSQRNTVVSPTK